MPDSHVLSEFVTLTISRLHLIIVVNSSVLIVLRHFLTCVSYIKCILKNVVCVLTALVHRLLIKEIRFFAVYKEAARNTADGLVLTAYSILKVFWHFLSAPSST